MKRITVISVQTSRGRMVPVVAGNDEAQARTFFDRWRAEHLVDEL